MKKKLALLTSISIFIFSVMFSMQSIKPVNADPSIIRVPEDYEKIQWAVGNATAGDTILVTAGTYYEQVTVNKSLTLIGENPSTTIIDGSLQRYVIGCFNTSHVNIRGFTIRNAIHGFNLTYSTNITISDNIIVNNIQFGVFLVYSSNNTIENNTISNNGYRGIYLRNLSNNNIVSNNTISNHNEYGIYIFNVSTSNIVSNNKILDNRERPFSASAYGICLRDGSTGNTISDNIISNNTYGISTQYSADNTLKNNNLTSNDYNFDIRAFALGQYIQNIDTSNTINGKPMYYWVDEADKQVPPGAGYVAAINSRNITVKSQNLANNAQGVLFAYTTESTIENVNASYNSIGINIVEEDSLAPPKSGNNLVKYNFLAGNSRSGVELMYSNNNTFAGNDIRENYFGVSSTFCNNTFYHNNFINNLDKTLETQLLSINVWDNGYPSGGNFWSDYKGKDLNSGPYQNELGSDGIGDTPYLIDENNIDNYPLMNPWGPVPPYGPTADFAYVPLLPLPNETVTFDASASRLGWNGTYFTSIVSYAWNFSDGTPIVITTSPTTTHEFTAEGNYTATLNVTDTQGFWDTTSKRVMVLPAGVPRGPMTYFVYEPELPPEDNEVTFNATLSAAGWNGSYAVPIANYTWNFGDTNVTTTTNPVVTHIYTKPREYNVTLTVTCEDDPELIKQNLTSHTTWKIVTVTDKTPPTIGGVIQSPATNVVDPNEAVSIIATNVTDNLAIKKVLLKYSIDNETFTDVTMTRAGEINNYTGQIPGQAHETYVTYKVYAEDSSRNFNETAIHAYRVLDTTPPVADAGPDQTVDEDTTVIFVGSGSTDNVGIVNYIWTFVDMTPQTLTGVSPNYTFATSGTYTVTLNVTDEAGNWATDFVVITVLDITPPVADAGPDQTVKVGTIVTFDASGSSDNVGIVSYEWDFGDGTNGSGVTTNHSYTKPGIYTVTLKVKDAANNSATDSIAVTVVSIPFPWWIAGLLAAAGILAAIVAYLVKVRKRAKT